MNDVRLYLRNKVGQDIRCKVGEMEFVVPRSFPKDVMVPKGERLYVYSEGLDFDYWIDDLTEDIAINVVRSGRQIQMDRGAM